VQASLALGSALWGAIASAAAIRIALAASVILLLLLHLVSRRLRVEMGTEADVTPSLHLPDLAMAVEPLPDDGPVLIQVEYRIDSEYRETFLRAIHEVEPIRRRNGAAHWRLYRDLGEDGRFVERYVIASWSEYVRQRMRMTISDRTLVDRVAELQRKDVPIRVSRLLAVNPGDGLGA
jgi:Transmembrane secretion effector